MSSNYHRTIHIEDAVGIQTNGNNSENKPVLNEKYKQKALV